MTACDWPCDQTATAFEDGWCEVPGTDGRYFVTRTGAVGSCFQLDRQIREVAAPVGKRGYRTVGLALPDGRKMRPIHALVTLTFLGPRPDGLVVRHLDGNRLHNCLSNLTYGTPKENSDDMNRVHGTNGRATQTHCKHGHEYTPENTAYENRRGHARICMTCKRAQHNESQRRIRAESRA